MPLQEFRIQLDNPTASFFPNQNVSGRVIVDTLNEKNTQGLKIKLDGRARVQWSEQRSATTNGKTHTATVNFIAIDEIIDLEVFVLGDGKTTITIPPGRHAYPFNFQLPHLLPSSYVGKYGKVRYGIEAVLKRSWKLDQEIKEPITVNAIVDLNTNPALAEPFQCRKEKNFFCLCCCSSGPVGFLIKLPTQGYVPGQYVTPVVEIYNKSSRTIKGVSLELIQNSAFFAQGRSKYSSKTVASATRGGNIRPGDRVPWKAKVFQIPSVPPSKLGGCNIIDVAYCLQFEIHVSGMAFNLKKLIPITIGTIPFKSAFSELSAEYAEAQRNLANGGGVGEYMPTTITMASRPSSFAPSKHTKPSPEKYEYLSESAMRLFMGPRAPAPSTASPTPTEQCKFSREGEDIKSPLYPTAPIEIYSPSGGNVKTSSLSSYPVDPKFYPDMPPMSFNTSIDFGGTEFEELDEQEQDSLIASGTDTNMNTMKDNFVPNYVNYGWMVSSC